MIVTIKEVLAEKPKGPKGYTKLSVFTEEYKFPQFIMDFAPESKDAYKVLKDAIPGEVYDISTIKNEKGYDTWTQAVKQDKPKTFGGTAGSVPAARGGTWETPEERARKQVLIVRQSSLAQAIETFKAQAIQPSGTEVTDLAQEYVNWVFQDMASPDSSLEDVPY